MMKKMRSISLRLSPSRLLHMILASLMASLSIGMPSRTRQCQLLVLQASALFWIKQRQSRIKKATTESTILFEGATNDGPASHIVRGHKEERDGRAAWHSLKDWYEGKTTSGDIAKTCRLKLHALELMPKGDAKG